MFRISAFLHFIYALFWLLSVTKLFAKECAHGGILENMILEGGINSNKHTIIKGINSVNLCINKCCTIKECDLAMFKRNICYSVSCDKENSCQISHSRNNSIENAKIVFMTRPREEASRQHTNIQHVLYQKNEKKWESPQSRIEREEDELDEALIESGDDINDLTSGSGITVGNDTLENEKIADSSLETDDSEGSSKDLENEETESEFSDSDFESGDSLLTKNNNAGVKKHEDENKFKNQIENLNFKSNNSKQQYKKENNTKLDSTIYHSSLKNTSLNAFKLMQNLSSSKNISNENKTLNDHLKHFNRTKKLSHANYFLQNNLSNYTPLKKMEKNVTQIFNFSLPANISKYKSMPTNSQKFQIKKQSGKNITNNFLIKSKRLNDKGIIKNKELNNSKKDKHTKFNTSITDDNHNLNNLCSNDKVYQKDSKTLNNSYSNKTKFAENSPTMLHNASAKLYNAPLKLYDAPTMSYNAPTVLYNNHTMRRRIDLLNSNNEFISNFTIYSPARISSPTQDSFVTEISTEFKNEQDNATYPVEDETDVIITPDGVLSSKLDNRTNEFKKDKENSIISNDKDNRKISNKDSRKIISDNDNRKIINDNGSSKISNVSNFLVSTDSLQMNAINNSVNRSLMSTTSKLDIGKEISGESESSGDSDSFDSGDSGEEDKSFKNIKGIFSGSGDAFSKDTEYNPSAEKIEDALDESTSIKKLNITHFLKRKNKASTTEKPTKDLFFMEIEDELLSGNGSNLTSQLQDQQSSGDINNLITETKNISKFAERMDALEQDRYWLDIINKTAETLLRNNSVDFSLKNETWWRNQSTEMNLSINSNSLNKTVLKEIPGDSFKTSSEPLLNSLNSENLTYSSNNILNETMSPTPQTRQLSQPIATMGIAKTQEESKEETFFNKTFMNHNESTDQKFSVVQNETIDVQDKTTDIQNKTTGTQSISTDFQIENTGFQDQATGFREQTTRIQNETMDFSDKRLYGSEYDEKNENAYQTFRVAPISLYPKIEFLKIYTPSKKSFLPFLKDNGYYNHGKYSEEEEINNEQIFKKKNVETKTRVQQSYDSKKIQESYDSISRDLIQPKDDSLKTEQEQVNGFVHAFERKQNKYDTVNFDPRVHYLGYSENRVSDTRDNKLDQTLESNDIPFSSFLPDSSNEKFENVDTDGKNQMFKTHLINTGIPANTKLGKMLMADLSEEESLGNAYNDQPTFKNPLEFKNFYQTNENGLGKINGEILDQDPVQQNQIFDNEALNDFKEFNEPENSNYMYSDKAFKVKENFFERKNIEKPEAVLKPVSKKKVRKSRTKNEKNKNYQNGNKNISWKTSNGTKIFPIKTKNNGPHKNIMPQSENTQYSENTPISRMFPNNSSPSKNFSNSTLFKTKSSRADKISETKAKKEENNKNDKLEETNFTKKKINTDYANKKEKEEENVIQGINKDINEKQYKILNEKLPHASIPWEKLDTNHNISINAADDNEGKAKTRKLFQTNKENNLFKEKHNHFNKIKLNKANSQPNKSLNHNKPKTSNSQYVRYALYRSKFFPPKNYNARKNIFSKSTVNVIKKIESSFEKIQGNYKNNIKVNSKKSLNLKHKSKEFKKKKSEGMKTVFPKKNALAQLQDLITQAKIGRYENVGNALSKKFQNSKKKHFGVDERNIHQSSNHSINQRRYQKIKEVREKVLRRFSSNNGTCRQGLTIHGGTLRGGVLSGEFKSMGVVDTQKACVQKCCKSDRCDVAMTIGRECINIRCFNRKLCNIAPAGNVGVYRDVLPVVTFVNRPVHIFRRSEIPRPLLFSEQDPYSVSEIIQQLDESEFSEVRKIIDEIDHY
ncbi:putative uncharacterized protein DDB_G0282133 [Hydra vulgaris]|uniref:putative uncharacterized protein DDB_G0282133 n=1 Tax=Hydra vulgaris TaxID=6087 RepID=UPI000640DD0C|nr:putative uncharacterized protein DDB_G0282133 [Hydra vulgaris]XP_047137967.1 putative uncharacterized protein DDB_G0282133 [Hydra vulgaris]XP_047137968.1 putative uncharacterized protein DDB_G0282133 [Hydra vulgaris]